MAILNWLNNVVETFGPEILLYVAINDLNDEDETWCLEYMFEIVELNKLNEDEPLSDFNEGSLSHLKEKTSYSRVYEALETHMWSHMNYESNLRPSTVNFDVFSADLLEDDFGNFDDEEDVLDAPNVDSQETLQGDAIDHNELIEMFKRLRADDNLEDQIEGFEKTMAEFTRIRELTKNAPDDKRREVAMNVALALSSLLGEDIDEDDI